MANKNSPLSSSKSEKPVIVRVKRKATQLPVDAFWLEINERPLKRALLDFGSLAISSSPREEILNTKKVLVQHLETVSTKEGIKDVLQSFMSTSTDAKEFKTKLEERKNMFKHAKRQEKLHSVAFQRHEDFVRNARFKQLWKSRRKNAESSTDPFHERCHLYDVVRVDIEEASSSSQKPNDSLLENDAILCNYLPLLREYLPTAAADIESEITACSSQGEYVYDLYAVGDDSNLINGDELNSYPLVEVENDDDYYDDPIRSEYESDDSNAEDNPMNDYPEEDSSEDDEHEHINSSDRSEQDELESENESSSDESEKDFYMHEEQTSDYDDNSEEDGWRWNYR